MELQMTLRRPHWYPRPFHFAFLGLCDGHDYTGHPNSHRHNDIKDQDHSDNNICKCDICQYDEHIDNNDSNNNHRVLS